MIRNLTSKFTEVRSVYTASPFFNQSMELDDDIVNDIELGDAFNPMVQPEWSKVLTMVRYDIENIEKRIAQLKILHANHTKHRTGIDSTALAQEEIQIEAQTAEIHRLFQVCKNNIASLQNTSGSKQDDVLLNNLRMKLVTELSDLTRNFRACQQKYLQGLKTLKEKKKEMNAIDYALAESDSDEERAMDMMLEKLDQGFTEEQVEFLIQNERDVLRRDKELKEILKSIYELQELFKDFSNLVVEQGTMLDRIDFNIERTQTYIRSGNKQLERTETYQKCSRWLICFIFLIVIVSVVAAALAVKLGFKYLPNLIQLLGVAI